MKPAQALLREVASVALGITLRGADASRHDPAGTHQLIRIGDLSDDGAVHCHELNLIKLNPETAARFTLRSGDILLAARGTRMTAGLFDSARPAVAGGQFLVIRPQTDMLRADYLRWFLNLASTQETLIGLARGSYVRSLSASSLAELEIPVPPLPRQRMMAELHTLRLREKELMVRLADRRAAFVDHALFRSLRH